MGVSGSTYSNRMNWIMWDRSRLPWSLWTRWKRVNIFWISFVKSWCRRDVRDRTGLKVLQVDRNKVDSPHQTSQQRIQKRMMWRIFGLTSFTARWLNHILFSFPFQFLHSTIRDKILNSFKSGKTQFLITTDIVKRGIDIPNLHYVLNYDFPTNLVTYISFHVVNGLTWFYVHRIGRTGRNNCKGYSRSFLTRNMSPLVPDLVDLLRANGEWSEGQLRSRPTCAEAGWRACRGTEAFGWVRQVGSEYEGKWWFVGRSGCCIERGKSDSRRRDGGWEGEGWKSGEYNKERRNEGKKDGRQE